jgi:hypothetical protein
VDDLWLWVGVGIAVVLAAMILYLFFLPCFPIWMQRPGYFLWRRKQIVRFKAGVFHPAIDQIVVKFFEERAEVEFKIGGIGRVILALNQIIDMVASSFEFQMILAHEMSQQMPNVSVTVIAVPPPSEEDRKQD